MDLNELKSKALQNQEVLDAYEELESEFDAIDTALKQESMPLKKNDNGYKTNAID
ncbi:hypothetical protein SDA22_06865 [Legionella pneumophila serogroup 1]|jgi:hypothetical protein|uniref:Uncharacterized protein n=2 Tax=Legionella TaxID=445 RepID=A0A0W0VCV6_9GAMM|nr:MULTISPECIES: hypothetical protein [Legionella]KTD17936.1 hypothetical protein Ljor_2242 [Legionella jordanis]MCW8435343.1 hypothetical protein [Legionella pneumophila]MCZ4691350.1 hypothetical protein [Legionella pneumophila]MCZ4711058.1 hypothetical protein [Legionella pneumophila]MCZ4719850.1 hypothetical protein [Legionella pneumophila]